VVSEGKQTALLHQSPFTTHPLTIHQLNTPNRSCSLRIALRPNNGSSACALRRGCPGSKRGKGDEVEWSGKSETENKTRNEFPGRRWQTERRARHFGTGIPSAWGSSSSRPGFDPRSSASTWKPSCGRAGSLMGGCSRVPRESKKSRSASSGLRSRRRAGCGGSDSRPHTEPSPIPSACLV